MNGEQKTAPTPQEIAEIFRAERAASRAVEDAREAFGEALSLAKQYSNDPDYRVGYIDAVDALQPALDAVTRELAEARYFNASRRESEDVLTLRIQELEAELAALKAHTQQMSEDALRRAPALVPLDEEQVRLMVRVVTDDMTSSAIASAMVAKFAAPAPTVAQCVAVLVEAGKYEKRLARSLGNGITTTDATDDITRSYVKAFTGGMLRTVLIAPAPEGADDGK